MSTKQQAVEDVSKPQPWLILGLNSEDSTVVIAGFAHTREDARAKAFTRQDNGEHDYTCFKIVQFSDSMGGEIEAWLLSNGVPALTRGRVIRQIGREIMAMMDDDSAVREYRRKVAKKGRE